MQQGSIHCYLARAVAFTSIAILAPSLASAKASLASAPQNTTAPSKPDTAGIPFTADKLQSLLPATVYFEGKSAPLQLRNAGGVAFAGDQILWVSLVDTSGYSSSVQERYQFYLVSEGRFRIGDTAMPAGVYGGGFLGDHFLLMDVGGHTVAQGPLQTDTGLRRPRPLQVLADQPNAVKLYLGRHWVTLQAGPQPRTP